MIGRIVAELVEAFLDPAAADQKARQRRRKLARDVEELLTEAAERIALQATYVQLRGTDRVFQFTGERRQIRAGEFHFCGGELRYCAGKPPIHECVIMREVGQGRGAPPPRSPAPPRADPVPAALKTLGLPLEAEPQIIRACFRELAKKYHPDLPANANSPKRIEKMRRYTDAFNTLKKAARA